ncbi:MAG: glycosyltransferase family 2 protein [Candidatus Nanopelagicales bacterium]
MQSPWAFLRTAGHRLSVVWRHSPQRIRRAAILALTVLSAYVVARLLFTRDEANPLSFWMLFIAEAMSLLSLILFAYEAWRLPPLAKYEPLRTSVDIAIATYNEPIDILEPTIVASLRVWDVRHVWVLDDGRRDEVRRLCEDLGARYATREDNKHAKAGNINAALPRIDSELILFLDADHVPQRNAIVDMSGYFRDPSVALVQSPHDFRNRDSAQHTHGTHHEQSLFFEVLMPARERHQAVFWCGSAALIRRSALVEVGGVATETVSEDLHTTLKLQLKGYTIRYHNDALVTGIAPHTTADYLLQRDRWARGTLAVLTGPESPLFGRGWRLSQRLHYVNNLLYYFLPLQRLLYVGVLLLALLLAWLPIGNVSALFAIAVSIVFATSLFASLALARGRLEIGEGASNTYLSAEIYVRALVTTVLRRKSGFAVTPKSISELTLGERLRVLALPTIVAVVIAVSWALRAAQQAFGYVVPGVVLPGTLTTTAFAILTFFAALELATVVPMLAREYRRRQKRQRWRFACSIPADIGGKQAVITDLHEEGLSFTSDASDIHTDDLVRVDFSADVADRRVQIHGVARVVRKAPLPGDAWNFGCTVEWDSDTDRRDLIDLCYVRLAGDDRAYLELASV